MKRLIIATAGHVDHGKTALVKALTGVDTDRLPEEKARGITIDLGFAHLELPGISCGLIDVPGHEDFVRNMIAGLGAIDLALLVVAADDGWMPQTEEHWQILNYLGVRRVVVAITKCDLADGTKTGAMVREKMDGHSLGEIPVVLTSVRNGTGLDDLKASLAQMCETLPAAPDMGKARMFIDRVFTLHGTGTVVTGTLAGGQLARGDSISLQPQNLRARVRAIQSHNRPLEVAFPATRTALNLPDLGPEEIPRGTVLTAVAGVEASRTIDVLIERSGRAALNPRPLKNTSVIQMHYGSARFGARIILLERRELLPGEKAIARLRCATPIFIFAGDRFVIRDSSGRATVAGGMVLDPDAEGTKFRSSIQRIFLQSRAVAPNDVGVFLRSQLMRDHVVPRVSLLVKSNFSEQEITAALERLVRDGEAFVHGDRVADSSWWKELRERAMAAIDAEHSAHPERAGLDLASLRARLALNDSGVYQALIADLCAREFACAKGAIRRQTHRPSLPPELAAAGSEIRAALTARPFDPPSRKELTPDSKAYQALRFLSETGEVIVVSEDVILTAESFAQMKKRIAEVLRERGATTVSELRQALGTTRRVLVPFLERCDRDGLTQRQGDRRALRPLKS